MILNSNNLLVSQECQMRVINILRDVWTRYGGGFNSLSPYEQEEFIHSAWILVLYGGVLACLVTLFVVLEP